MAKLNTPRSMMTTHLIRRAPQNIVVLIAHRQFFGQFRHDEYHSDFSYKISDSSLEPMKSAAWRFNFFKLTATCKITLG